MKANEKEGLLIYHQKLIGSPIQKESGLIRSTTYQGTSWILSFFLKRTWHSFLLFFFWCSYGSIPAYGQSKLCNVLHANELARQLKVTTTKDRSIKCVPWLSWFSSGMNKNQEDGVNITVNSLHPGAIMTSLWRYFNSYLAGNFFSLWLHTCLYVDLLLIPCVTGLICRSC